MKGWLDPVPRWCLVAGGTAPYGLVVAHCRSNLCHHFTRPASSLWLGPHLSVLGPERMAVIALGAHPKAGGFHWRSLTHTICKGPVCKEGAL